MKEHKKIIQLMAALFAIGLLSISLSDNPKVSEWSFYRVVDSHFIDFVTTELQPKTWDVIFLGSSLAGFADNAPVLKEAYGIDSINLAHIHHDASLDYQILLRFLNRHKVKKIVLDFIPLTGNPIHVWTSLTVDRRTAVDVFRHTPLSGSFSDFKIVSNGLVNSYLYMSSHLFTAAIYWPQQHKCFKSQSCTELFETNGTFQGTAALERLSLKKDRPTERQASEAAQPYRFSSKDKFYFQKISDLAAAQGIELWFVEIPTFKKGYLEKEDLLYFQKLGKVLLYEGPEFSIDDWRDLFHLDVGGSKRYSIWLGERIK